MNKSKQLILMLVCALSATFMTTSCLNSDDDNNTTSQMTREDSTACVMNAMGSYSGKLVYVKPASVGTSAKNDSVDVSWSIDIVTETYGQLTMNNFPVSVLSPYVSSSSFGDSPQEILAAAKTITYNTYLVPYSRVTTSGTTQYGYSIYPRTETKEFTVDYNDTSHKVVIKYAAYLQVSSSGYYYAIALKKGKHFEGNIIVSSITIDNMEYSVGTLLYFHN